MADPITNPDNNITDPAANGGGNDPQGGGGGNGGEKLFSQADVDAMINKRLARERKNQPSEEELAAFREYQKTHAPKDDAAKLKDMTCERDTAQTELEIARRENFLLRQGIDPEDVDYYAYTQRSIDIINQCLQQDKKERPRNGPLFFVTA